MKFEYKKLFLSLLSTKKPDKLVVDYLQLTYITFKIHLIGILLLNLLIYQIGKYMKTFIIGDLKIKFTRINFPGGEL